MSKWQTGRNFTQNISSFRYLIFHVLNAKNIFFHLGSSCRTVGGQRRVSNPEPDQPCNFPFIWNGISHNSCINDADGNWCSTHVNRRGEYIDKKWGICSSTCPGKNYRYLIISFVRFSLIRFVFHSFRHLWIKVHTKWRYIFMLSNYKR